MYRELFLKYFFYLTGWLTVCLAVLFVGRLINSLSDWLLGYMGFCKSDLTKLAGYIAEGC